jgi:sugar/nucleoside kinase (ribokinase family)
MGDALVDVIATCDVDFIDRFGLPKGAMQLLEPDQALALYDAMGSAREMSGGSAANSMAGAAAMGANVAFLGQVAADQLGTIFTHDMRALGVRFDTEPLVDGPPTGRCLILVTPDGERTMNTCPGAAHCLPPSAVDEAAVRSASILYLEGYLFGPELPRAAMFKAIDIAHAAERTVAFTLSESVCLPGRKEPLQKLMTGGIAAAEIISHFGARPVADLAELVKL